MFDLGAAIAASSLIFGTSAILQIPDREIRLRQIAVAEETDDLVLARIPAGTTQITLDVETAERLIRNRLPGVSFKLTFEGKVTLVAPPKVVLGGLCYTAARTIAASQVIHINDVEEARCGDSQETRKVVYDRSKAAPVATSTIDTGSFLGPIHPANSRRIAKDEVVTLTTGDEAVTIKRTVTALQSGREGRKIFVRTSDDQVFSVPVANLDKENR